MLDLATILHEASSEPDPLKALEHLVDSCKTQASARCVRLFRLSLAKSVYKCILQSGSGTKPHDIPVEFLNRKNPPSSIREKVILSRKLQIFDSMQVGSNTGSVMLLPIVRGDECLGLLELELADGQSIRPGLEEFVASVTAAASMLFEKQHSLDLLESLQKPIDFHQRFNDFLDDLIVLISDASGMPYIALREYVNDSDGEVLRCLAQWGFIEKDELSLDELNLQPIHPSFKQVLQTRTTKIEPDIDAPHLKEFSEWLRKIKRPINSFVIAPVNVGDSIFGTISFACSCKYQFSRLEVVGFESIANTIGVSITNYRNFHSRQAEILDKIKTSTTITAVEVAQAARHEARSHLDNAKTILLLMEDYASKATRDTLVKLSSTIPRMEEEIQNIELSLDRIKDITKPPQREEKLCVLNELWRDAFAVVQGRLVSEQINHEIIGKNVEAEVFPDFLLHAFLNLILNSIDAFKEFGRKRNRLISVAVETPSDSANTIRMKYTDNAGGIDPSKLIGPKDGPLTVDDIFTAGVSSKKKGSGYGLYLIRNILHEHDGGIRLISHRGGVQFEITLPK